MARGWESKAIESQQEEAGRRSVSSGGPLRRPEDRERAQRRQTLTLARQRVLADLQHACNAAHRSHLTASLAALDTQLATLDAQFAAPEAIPEPSL